MFIWYFFIPSWLRALWLKKSLTLKIPVCDRHRLRLHWAYYLALLFVLCAMVVTAIWLWIGNLERGPEQSRALAIGFFAMLPLPVVLIAAIIVKLTGPRMDDYDQSSIVLLGVSREFAQAVAQSGMGSAQFTDRDRRARGAQAATAPPYGQHGQRPATSAGSSKTLWIVLGSVAGVGVLGLLVCGGGWMYLQSRNTARNPVPPMPFPNQPFPPQVQPPPQFQPPTGMPTPPNFPPQGNSSPKTNQVASGTSPDAMEKKVLDDALEFHRKNFSQTYGEDRVATIRISNTDASAILEITTLLRSIDPNMNYFPIPYGNELIVFVETSTFESFVARLPQQRVLKKDAAKKEVHLAAAQK